MNRLGNKILLIVLGIVIGLAIMVPFVPFTSNCNAQHETKRNSAVKPNNVDHVSLQQEFAFNWQRMLSI